jgi:hypothetical protein
MQPLFFGAIFLELFFGGAISFETIIPRFYPICAFCAIYGEKAAQWLTPSVSPFGPLRISQSYMPGTNHSPDCTSFKKSSQNLSSELTASFYVS